MVNRMSKRWTAIVDNESRLLLVPAPVNYLNGDYTLVIRIERVQ